MAPTDWNWKHAVELQDVPWDCAAASLAWCLQAWGMDITEQQVVTGLGPARISPAYGLLDSSGSGLVEYLGQLGLPAKNATNVSFHDVEVAAGEQPLLMGGAEWYHWTGVRMSGYVWGHEDVHTLLLANPAPGYMGVGQYMDTADFDILGPFNAVWFPVI